MALEIVTVALCAVVAAIEDQLRAYCTAIGIEVGGEATSLFDVLAVMFGEEAEAIRVRVIETLISEWESLRVLDTQDRGLDHYVETAENGLGSRLHLEAACRAAWVRVIMHDASTRSRLAFGPSTASVFDSDGRIRELVSVRGYYAPVTTGMCQPWTGGEEPTGSGSSRNKPGEIAAEEQGCLDGETFAIAERTPLPDDNDEVPAVAPGVLWGTSQLEFPADWRSSDEPRTSQGTRFDVPAIPSFEEFNSEWTSHVTGSSTSPAGRSSYNGHMSSILMHEAPAVDMATFTIAGRQQTAVPETVVGNVAEDATYTIKRRSNSEPTEMVEQRRRRKRRSDLELIPDYRAKLRSFGPAKISAGDSTAARAHPSLQDYQPPKLQEYPEIAAELRVPVISPYLIKDGAMYCNLARCPLSRNEPFSSLRAWKLHVVHTAAHALDGYCHKYRCHIQLPPDCTLVEAQAYMRAHQRERCAMVEPRMLDARYEQLEFLTALGRDASHLYFPPETSSARSRRARCGRKRRVARFHP